MIALEVLRHLCLLPLIKNFMLPLCLRYSRYAVAFSLFLGNLPCMSHCSLKFPRGSLRMRHLGRSLVSKKSYIILKFPIWSFVAVTKLQWNCFPLWATGVVAMAAVLCPPYWCNNIKVNKWVVVESGVLLLYLVVRWYRSIQVQCCTAFESDFIDQILVGCESTSAVDI